MNYAMIPSDRTAFRIGDWRIAPALDEISRDGVTAKLEPRTMRVLVCLAEHAGEVLSVEQLLDAVWKDVVVTHHSLYQAVAGLRRALGDDPKNPIYIANVLRRGYRLIAPVVPAEHRQIAASPHRESAPHVDAGWPQRPQAIETPPRSHDRLAAVQAPVEPGPRLGSPATNGVAVQPAAWARPAIVATVIAVLVLLAGTSAYVYLRRGGERAAGTPQAIHSLVVLPLENLSGDKAQEYFADGMTDALITDLAQIGSLRVISRTSAMQLKGSKETLPQIGRDLQVDAVVEGTVARAENRVRVTAQLVEARTDHHLWARTYERDLKNVLALQDEIAQDITEQIRVKLTPKERGRLMQVHVVDPEAYDAFLRGRYWLNSPTREGAWKALDYFQKAIAKDPQYALAYAGVADSFLGLGFFDVGAHRHRLAALFPRNEAFPKAREAAVKALALDPSLAEAHTALAIVKFYMDWDWSGAEYEFKRAVSLNPNYATAHHNYSNYLVAMGRLDEAMKEIERARDLDPLSVQITFWLGQALYHARRYDDALGQDLRGLEMLPENSAFYGAMADVYEQKKMFAEAFAALQHARSLENDPNVTALGEAYKRSGYRGYLLREAQFLEQQHNLAYAAHPYALLDDEAHAMTALEAAYNERNPGVLFIRTAPELDSIRSSPRFRDLVRRIGFPPSPSDKN